MSNLKVVLNRSGVRQMLKSAEMRAICEEHAAKIQVRCGAGYEMESYTEETRAVAEVRAVTYQAKADNASNNTILKAVRG